MRIIDISSNNHPNEATIDWRAVRQSGVDGVYVKATEGTGYTNPWFGRDVNGAKAEGLAVGVYHFARPTPGGAAAELRQFMSAADRYAYALPHALDLEDGAQLGWSPLAAWARQWLTLAASTLGPVALYVNRNYLERLPGCPFGALLWLADPSAHPSYPCWLWQEGSGHVPGIAGPVDLDVLQGAPGPASFAPGGPQTSNLPIADRPTPPPAQMGIPVEIDAMQIRTDFYPNPNPLDNNGHGYLDLPDVPWEHKLSVEPQGPLPDAPPHGNGDGYWPPVHVEPANHDGHLQVTFYGSPGQASAVWVTRLVD